MNVLLILAFLKLWVNFVRGEFRQNDYHIDHEKIIITKYNHSCVFHPHVELIKHEGVRMLAISGSALFTPGVYKNMPIKASVFKFAKGKFRPFPINVTIDGCAESNTNLFGAQSAIAASNFRGCPCVPGEYYIKDYLLEEDLFPPHLPLGRYKLVVHVKVDDTTFLVEGVWEGRLSKRDN